MQTYGLTAIIGLLVLGLLALLLFAGSFAGFAGEWPMVLGAVLALVLWGVWIGIAVKALTLSISVRGGDGAALAACLSWTGTVAWMTWGAALLTAFVCAALAFSSCGPLWLAGLYHWGGLVMSALGFAFWIVRSRVAAASFGGQDALGWGAALATILGVYAAWALVWLILWLVLRGSIDSSTYPTAATSPFKLPLPGGESTWVVQGNNSNLNHKQGEEHAFDFRLRCGTPVLAAAAGTVRTVTDGNSGKSANNEIAVTHADGSVGRYLHIEHGSAVVAVGDAVAQGDELAKVGNVGNSLTGHIHFVVEVGGQSVPVSFSDVADDSGIPRTFKSYTSGNR